MLLEISLAASPESSQPATKKRWQWWYWAALPLLAFIAYFTVLRIGFLGDDFVLLGWAKEPGVDMQALLPGSRWFFYRPVGVFFTWELGWHLWGYNPFPYHLAQLLMHAGTALLLGLWLAYATGRKLMGWLAGAIFAVFPSHGEAVGWIAAQWDALSVLLGVGSLWCFTAWWRVRTPHTAESVNAGESKQGRLEGWRLYAAALLLYTLATLTKEGIFTFVLMLGISAWFVNPPRNRATWVRLALALLPFFVIIGANLYLRVTRLGGLGGYPFARYDYGEFIWDSFSSYMRFLLAPLNPTLWGNAWIQIIGILQTIAILVGLALFGRSQRRLLFMAACWITLALLPVLSLPIMGRDDFRDTRFMYLPAAGFCIGLAALAYEALSSARRLRPVFITGLGILLAASMAACWVQVSPWRDATDQVDEIVGELLEAIPPQPRPNGLVWFVENVPERYKGSLMLNWGLGLSRVYADEKADYPRVERVADATQALAASDARDSYAIRFAYTQSDTLGDRWTIDYLSGVTGITPPPTADEAGEGKQVWDFRGCAPDVVGSWSVSQARAGCVVGTGLVIEPTSDDPQITGPPLNVALSNSTKFVRLRIGVRYPNSAPDLSHVSQWFWEGPRSEYGEEHQRSANIIEDAKPHVYWTFIPADQVEGTLTGLRFDPVNAQIRTEIEWIAVDLTK